MSKIRSWVFRIFVIIGGGVFVTSWFLPWWGAWVQALGRNDVIRIYPYGLWDNLGGWKGFMGNMGEMPAWFGPLMWIYFALLIVALFFAIWKMNITIRLFNREFNLSRLIIGIAGLSYAIVILIFYLYAKARVEALGVNWIGQSYVEQGVIIHTYAYTGYRVGLWVACAVGPFLVLLALLKNLIVGKK